MAEYTYPQDGKVHTRYSELVRCTEGQIEQVMLERHGDVMPFISEAMIFGRERHTMFEDEVSRTGQIPECFRIGLKGVCDLEFPADVNEKEFTAEIFRNVVLHSQPDTISVPAKVIVDYKSTTSGAKQYAKSKQLLVYAYQLMIHGIEIERYVFLCELWNKERDQILGYECYDRKITRDDILEVREWLKERVSILRTGLRVYKQHQKLYGEPVEA